MSLSQHDLGCLTHASHLIADAPIGTAVAVTSQPDVDPYAHATARPGLAPCLAIPPPLVPDIRIPVPGQVVSVEGRLLSHRWQQRFDAVSPQLENGSLCVTG